MKKNYIAPAMGKSVEFEDICQINVGSNKEEAIVGPNGFVDNEAKERQSIDFSDEESIW